MKFLINDASIDKSNSNMHKTCFFFGRVYFLYFYVYIHLSLCFLWYIATLRDGKQVCQMRIHLLLSFLFFKFLKGEMKSKNYPRGQIPYSPKDVQLQILDWMRSGEYLHDGTQSFFVLVLTFFSWFSLSFFLNFLLSLSLIFLVTSKFASTIQVCWS